MQVDDRSKRLVIRLDDVGFCHAANEAFARIAAEGLCTSVSAIVTTPWIDEAAELFAQHPEIDVGVHLTLNSEWRGFRWGPVAGAETVPSLVDAAGRFPPSRAALFAGEPDPAEASIEMRAQIERALSLGLHVRYCDYHMGAAISCAEFQHSVEILAAEYGIGIARWHGEREPVAAYTTPPDETLRVVVDGLATMTEPGTYLLVFHPGLDVPEMRAMTDLNEFGLREMSRHRQAETDLLCAPAFRKAVEDGGFTPVGYGALGPPRNRPFEAPRLAEVVREARE